MANKIKRAAIMAAFITGGMTAPAASQKMPQGDKNTDAIAANIRSDIKTLQTDSLNATHYAYVYAQTLAHGRDMDRAQADYTIKARELINYINRADSIDPTLVKMIVACLGSAGNVQESAVNYLGAMNERLYRGVAVRSGIGSLDEICDKLAQKRRELQVLDEHTK